MKTDFTRAKYWTKEQNILHSSYNIQSSRFIGQHHIRLFSRTFQADDSLFECLLETFVHSVVDNEVETDRQVEKVVGDVVENKEGEVGPIGEEMVSYYDGHKCEEVEEGDDEEHLASSQVGEEGYASLHSGETTGRVLLLLLLLLNNGSLVHHNAHNCPVTDQNNDARHKRIQHHAHVVHHRVPVRWQRPADPRVEVGSPRPAEECELYNGQNRRQ